MATNGGVTGAHQDLVDAAVAGDSAATAQASVPYGQQNRQFGLESGANK
jgi:hypothetical protein